MRGKEKCEFFCNIRKNIAEMNNLDYKPRVCTHQGWCPGFCPLCDSEAADLMKQLELREVSGSTIKIDVESIRALDTMARINEDSDDDYSIADDVELMGMPRPIEPEIDEEMLPSSVHDKEVLYRKNKDQDACLNIHDAMFKTKVEEVCKGCVRYGSVKKQDGMPVRCTALSEHFFDETILRGWCSLKKMSDEDQLHEG